MYPLRRRVSSAAVVRVLRAPGPLGDVARTCRSEARRRSPAPSVRSDSTGVGAGRAAERPVARARALVEVERHDGNLLALDVFPDVELGPVEQRMDAHVRARRELGLVLVPELGRLLGDVPRVVA